MSLSQTEIKVLHQLLKRLDEGGGWFDDLALLEDSDEIAEFVTQVEQNCNDPRFNRKRHEWYRSGTEEKGYEISADRGLLYSYFLKRIETMLPQNTNE